MGIEANIMLALRARLVAFAQPRSIPIAFSNKNFTPPPTGRYIRETFLPNGTSRRFLGSSDPQRHQGLYQIDVMSKHDAGETEPTTLAGEVAAHFATDLKLSAGGTTVRITKRPEVASLLIDDTQAMIPVTITWDAWA